MNNRANVQKNQPSTAAPVQNQLKSPSFPAQAKSEASLTPQETPSSPTQHGRGESSVHNLANIPILAPTTASAPIQRAITKTVGELANDVALATGTTSTALDVAKEGTPAIDAFGVIGGVGGGIASVQGGQEAYEQAKQGHKVDAALSGGKSVTDAVNASATTAQGIAGFTGNAAAASTAGTVGGITGTLSGGFDVAKGGKKIYQGQVSKNNLRKDVQQSNNIIKTDHTNLKPLILENQNLMKIMAAAQDPNEQRMLQDKFDVNDAQINAISGQLAGQIPVQNAVSTVARYGAEQAQKQRNRGVITVAAGTTKMAGGITTLAAGAAPGGAIAGGALSIGGSLIEPGAGLVRTTKQAGRNRAARNPNGILGKIFNPNKSTTIKDAQRNHVAQLIQNNQNQPDMQKVFGHLPGVSKKQNNQYRQQGLALNVINERLQPNK